MHLFEIGRTIFIYYLGISLIIIIIIPGCYMERVEGMRFFNFYETHDLLTFNILSAVIFVQKIRHVANVP